MLKNFLGRLFAFWAITVFAFTLILVLVPIAFTSLWPEPRRTVLLHDVFEGWMKVFFVAVGVRRIFKGKAHFKKGENYVVVCNHNSFMDVPLTSPGIPGPNKTIAKIEMARIPLFGMVYKSGSVLVDRKNERSRKESYAKMKAVLQMGLHMCIYPEGTRNTSGEPLQRFHDGAFKLAVDCGKPVMPAVIFYTAEVLPRHRNFFFWPHRVEMHFLPPVSPLHKTYQQLREEVHTIMRNYYVQHNH